MHAKRMLSMVAMAGSLAACSGGSDSDSSLSATGKFKTLGELLDNEDVQAAIADLPAGSGVAKGRYYEGDTPADITGVWSTSCCGGSTGSWARNPFGATLDYRVVGKGKVDLASFESTIDEGDGAGSFITGTDNQVTVFLQLAVTCKQNDEHVRAVAIDRFVYDEDQLSEYVRSYVVLARENALKDARCFADAVGSGMVSTPAVFGRKE